MNDATQLSDRGGELGCNCSYNPTTGIEVVEETTSLPRVAGGGGEQH